MSRVVVRLWHLLSWLELLDSLDDKSSTTSRTTTLDIDIVSFFLSIKHYLGRGSGGGNHTNDYRKIHYLKMVQHSQCSYTRYKHV